MESLPKCSFSRPKIVISRCLGFDNCRYDGQIVQFPLAEAMKPFVEFIDVCPEYDIGLGIPREPILIVEDIDGSNRKLIQPATGLDLTDKMKSFSRFYLEKLDDFDGFILKSKSPSCGIGTTKVFPDAEADEYTHHEGNGFFAETVLHDYSEIPVIDEEQIKDPIKRDYFLTRVFVLASFRDASVSCKLHSLVRFHTDNKLLFMAYNKQIITAMGNIVANRENLPAEKVYEDYTGLLMQILSEAPQSGPVINAFMHAFGYFSRHLSAAEKFGFMQQLQKLRTDDSVIFELRKWFMLMADTYNVEYLSKQTLFCPYPPELSV
ncbi:DUF523 and DUF1722 domain-containing protein [Methanolobus sediminis]|uniref:DUF523 and DUF1722 domain-containing protein n=1 Tax=Methanolobus sediminis TaxID=3072978 RepID=A0AA51ULI3_9EURY|nr:DUF523 and DUF1722 domain-containing protein [Methanolobus sediminis]WMW24526.1 DUF523 and DUF1722 domain-containing protein [Methanolobus sediminis]